MSVGSPASGSRRSRATSPGSASRRAYNTPIAAEGPAARPGGGVRLFFSPSLRPAPAFAARRVRGIRERIHVMVNRNLLRQFDAPEDVDLEHAFEDEMLKHITEDTREYEA